MLRRGHRRGAVGLGGLGARARVRASHLRGVIAVEARDGVQMHRPQLALVELEGETRGGAVVVDELAQGVDFVCDGLEHAGECACVRVWEREGVCV